MDQKERESIPHFSHPHNLVLNEEQSDKMSKEACCSVCLEPLVGLGPCFSCGECDFHLHKKCAQAPLEISHYPFHSKHPTLTLKLIKGRALPCDLCKEERNMFFYLCFDCLASFDIKCAFLLHSIDANFRELKYVAHTHPLTFSQSPQDELKKAHCNWCRKPVVDSAYVCLDCRFYLHKKCAQLPTQLNHPSHRKHTLYIENDLLFCKVCQKKHRSLFYGCLPCKFDIDIECVRSRPWSNFEDTNCHEHSFTQLIRDELFICDACGTEGNYFSDICSTCNIMIHKNCISLPRIIRTTRHHHYITHKYFFEQKELGEHDCGVCLRKVKAEYGSYNCFKQDCDYVAHVNCALEMYAAIDQVNEEDGELATNSSIFVLLKGTNVEKPQR